jgi:dienelactone hydrolase
MSKSHLVGLLFAMLIITVPCSGQKIPAPQDVDLTAPDGIKLKATYFSAGKPGPGVLLLHQCGEQQNNWDAVTTRLAAAGINVLTMDYRGHGESGGVPIDKLSNQEDERLRREKWPGDIDTALAYLESQPGVAIGIVGAGGGSCGVNMAIRLAQRHPEVKSLVLLSTPILYRNEREFVRNARHLPMFISAADDDFPEPEVMQWVYELSPNPGSRFVHYHTGGHGVQMFAAHKELPGKIVEWYVQTLIRTPGSAPSARTAGPKKRPPAILELIDSPGGPARVEEQLAEARKRDPKANLFSQALVNMLGYTHIWDGDYKGAIEIMKLNVAADPKSPGPYDSLADAYLAAGQKELTRKTVKREIKLLSSDTADNEETRKAIRGWAEEKLKQLGEKP